MGKIIRKFSFIMLINMLAFLSIWHILDLNLNTGARYKIIFLVLSVFSLIIISKKYFKKVLKDFEEIKSIDENNKNNKK